MLCRGNLRRQEMIPKWSFKPGHQRGGQGVLEDHLLYDLERTYCALQNRIMHVSHAAAKQDKPQIAIWHPQREKNGREEGKKMKKGRHAGIRQRVCVWVIKKNIPFSPTLFYPLLALTGEITACLMLLTDSCLLLCKLVFYTNVWGL